MRSYLIAVLAAFALLMAACTTGDDGASPLSTPVGAPVTSPTTSPTLDETDASPTETDETMEASPTESPEETETADATRSPDDTDDASPSASPTDDDDGAGGTASRDCEEAFEDVPDLSRIDSLRQFQDAISALEETIEACDSVQAWTDEAEQQLDLGNLGLDAEQFLEDRCDESDDLEDTAICEEL